MDDYTARQLRAAIKRLETEAERASTGAMSGPIGVRLLFDNGWLCSVEQVSQTSLRIAK